MNGIERINSATSIGSASSAIAIAGTAYATSPTANPATNPATMEPPVGSTESYSAPGMPPLDMQGRATSFFEFWPAWLVYIPVIVQWLGFSLRYRSVTLPLLANPTIPLSGMAGVAKSELLSQASGVSDEHILSWFVHTCSPDSDAQQASLIEAQLPTCDIQYPFVCKPEIGCRGAGVKRIANNAELQAYIKSYPPGETFMVQKMSAWEPEAGIFYVRKPRQQEGEIISLGLKYMPYVIGDGHSTLRQLLEGDARIHKLLHVYESRHEARFDDVIPKGETYRLVFAASHSRGAIFRDGRHHISPALRRRLDAVVAGLPGFYYGRLDIKFRDIDELERGEGVIDIIEINTASSEPLHIWDRNAAYGEAMRALLYQYKLMWQIGAANRKRGYAPPSLLALIKGWRKEMNLTHAYPDND